MDDRRSTAIHEAGHAVIGRVLGIPFGGATIEADEDSDGHSICPDQYEIAQAWDDAGIYHRGMTSVYRARILAWMAGAEAERECLGAPSLGDGDDRRWIDIMLEELLPAGADTAKAERRLRQACWQLVRRHRSTIERVAALLIERVHMTANEIDEVVGR